MPGRSTAMGRGGRRNRSAFPGLMILAAAILGAAVILKSEIAPSQSEAKAPIVVGQFDTISLPVPVSFVPAGTKMKDIRFRNVSFPNHQVPEGALSSVTEYLEATTLAPLPANLPLFKENFSLLGGVKNPVIERIPAGMRAMSIRVDATSSVEGWAGSGSVVDVLLVEKDRTTVVAEKVKVLSAERSVSPVEGAAAPSVPSTVTVLVTQEQCLAINTAIPRGKLAFALRSGSDEDNWSDTIFTAERLTGNSALLDERAAVSGFVSVQSADGTDSFALSNGKWVRSEVVPEGFFAARER
ncbi:MAG: Flp pilus assembly protein CpaB [Deltaproteobacteria bacterium]|nr:Flp pilus assembly protein CpaB [Deltaproteobacteria bacterium]